MPSSSYGGFDVLIDNDDGTTTPVATHPVHVYDVTNSVALADVASDGVGHVATGMLAVVVGTTVRFWVDLGNGRVGFNEVITA
jgi:hypothetical protein